MTLRSTLTKQGTAVLASAHQGNKLTITRMALGSGELPPGELADRQSLVNEVYRFPISRVKRDGAHCLVTSEADGSGASAGYGLTEIGLYAADPENPNDRDKDVLYAICTAPPGDIFGFISPDESVNNIWIITVHCVVSASQEIEVTLTHELAGEGDRITQEDLDKYTLLSVFQPIIKNNMWYGEHRHDASTIDGLEDAGWQVGDIRITSYHLPEDPDGDYMLCDGREIDLTDYPELDKKWDYPRISLDGTTTFWTQRFNRFDGASGTYTLINVGYSQELLRFVAVGYVYTGSNAHEGIICYSDDGINWIETYQYRMELAAFYVIIWVPDLKLFVAGGNYRKPDNGYGTSNYSGMIMYSSDGINWTGASRDRHGISPINSICWSPEINMLVAVESPISDNLALRHQTLFSSDAKTWASVLEDSTGMAITSNLLPGPGTWDLHLVLWSHQLKEFIAFCRNDLNRIAISKDGIKWIWYGGPEQIKSMNYIKWIDEKGMYIGLGVEASVESGIYTSLDGLVWNFVTSIEDGAVPRMISWSPELNIFVTELAVPTDQPSRRSYIKLLKSSDLITWEEVGGVTPPDEYPEGRVNNYILGNTIWAPGHHMFVSVSTKGIYTGYPPREVYSTRVRLPLYNEDMPFTYLKVK